MAAMAEPVPIRIGPAFSNGAEGDLWAARYCDRCTRDGDVDVGEGCEHILTALLGEVPAPWQVHSQHRWHCTEFSLDPADAPDVGVARRAGLRSSPDQLSLSPDPAQEAPVPTPTADVHLSRWNPDDEHVAAAAALAGALGNRFFDDVCDAYRVTGAGRGTYRVENLEDGPLDRSDPALVEVYERAAACYDMHAFPVVYVDDRGRRFEVDVEVTVTAVPSVQVQLAERDAETAQHRSGRGDDR